MQITTTVLKEIREKALRVAKEAYKYLQDDEEHVYINEDGDFVVWVWDTDYDNTYGDSDSVTLKLSDLLMHDAGTLVEMHKNELKRVADEYARQQAEQMRLRTIEANKAREEYEAKEYERLKAKFKPQ